LQYSGANQITPVTSLPDNTVSTYNYDDLVGSSAPPRPKATAGRTARQDTTARRITQELTGEAVPPCKPCSPRTGASQSEIDASDGLRHYPPYDQADDTSTTDQTTTRSSITTM
jgi:hypothetical protein